MLEELTIDEVIINHGYERERSLLEDSKVMHELIDGHYFDGQGASGTTVPGIYVAGDILKYDKKLQLIAGAFQDAANAVNQAMLHLQPEAYQSGTVSSHNDIFTVGIVRVMMTAYITIYQQVALSQVKR